MLPDIPIFFFHFPPETVKFVFRGISHTITNCQLQMLVAYCQLFTLLIVAICACANMALKAAKRYKGYANTPTKFNAQKLFLNLLDSFDIVDIEF